MATIKAVIVDTDGTVRHTDIESSLGAFQAVVGGYIEGVINSVATMYVNEEGILRRLPFNYVASMFANNLLGRQGMQLFGPALILGPPDDEGNDTDVRPAVVEYFTKEN
jgi:hypothetical protein